jgi:hypothetical protein
MTYQKKHVRTSKYGKKFLAGKKHKIEVRVGELGDEWKTLNVPSGKTVHELAEIALKRKINDNDMKYRIWRDLGDLKSTKAQDVSPKTRVNKSGTRIVCICPSEVERAFNEVSRELAGGKVDRCPRKKGVLGNHDDIDGDYIGHIGNTAVYQCPECKEIWFSGYEED